MAEIEMVGKMFGKWKVISSAPPDKYKTKRWNCLCICGVTGIVGGVALRRGKSKGCKKCGGISTKPYEALYRRLCRVAKRKDLEVMSYDEFLGFTNILNCSYCGLNVKWAMYSKRQSLDEHRYNLDKKDSNLGYTKNNCVVCCWPCNRRKNSLFTYEQFVQVGNLIRSWNETNQSSVVFNLSLLSSPILS